MKIVGRLCAVLLCALCLASCSAPVSSYRAVGFVRSNTSSSAKMSFFEFEGRMVFRLKNKKAGSVLDCSASLEEGEFRVTREQNGASSELFALSSGGETETSVTLDEAGTFYVVVETFGRCMNGSLDFDLGGLAEQKKK